MKINIFNTKISLLFIITFLNATIFASAPLPNLNLFRLAACSTTEFKKLIRGEDCHRDGDQQTVVEIWHTADEKPELYSFREMAALPTAGLRIEHKIRRLIDRGLCTDSFPYEQHEITYHTLVKDLAATSATISAQKETTCYPTNSAKPHSIVPVEPSKETTALLVGYISTLKPYLARTFKPDTPAQSMIDEFAKK